MQQKNPKTAGFTLIELLVVVAIIGLLSSVVLASLNSARAKARDARRIMDLNTVSKALELYYDKYGQYPTPNYCAAWYHTWSGWDAASCGDSTTPGLIITSDNGVQPYLKEFLSSEFQAPQFDKTSNAGKTYFYCNNSACSGVSVAPANQHYVLAVYLENPTSSIMQNSLQGVFYGAAACGANSFYCIGH